MPKTFSLSWHKKDSGVVAIFFVMAQKNGAKDEKFIVMALPCVAVEEIFFVMAHKSDGNAPNRFAVGEFFFIIEQKCLDGEVVFVVIPPEGIAGTLKERASGQEVLVMADGNPATADVIPVAEPAGGAGGRADCAERPHDLRHLKMLTSGTSRKGGQLRRCA